MFQIGDRSRFLFRGQELTMFNRERNGRVLATKHGAGYNELELCGSGRREWPFKNNLQPRANTELGLCRVLESEKKTITAEIDAVSRSGDSASLKERAVPSIYVNRIAHR
jgi:hypothetical protein